jgi:serine/threonine protein kinase
MTLIATGAYGRVYRTDDRITKTYYSVGDDQEDDIGELITEVNVYNDLRRAPSLPYPNMNVSFTLDHTTASLHMKYMGEPLHERRARDDWVSAPDLVRSIIYQIIEQLYVIHATGHVHLDIRAANIVIDGDGRVTLIDFGMSKYNNSGVATLILACQPPEMLASKKYVSEDVDIWTVGALFLQLMNPEIDDLLSDNPVDQEVIVNKIVAHLKGEEVYDSFARVLVKFSEIEIHLLTELLVNRSSAESLLKHEYFGDRRRDIPCILPRKRAEYSPVTGWTHITWRTIGIAIEWAVKILKRFKCDSKVIFDTIDLMYQFLKMVYGLAKERLQVLTCACMYVSILISGRGVTYDDFVWVSGYAFKCSDLEDMLRSVVALTNCEKRDGVREAMGVLYPHLSVNAQEKFRCVLEME